MSRAVNPYGDGHAALRVVDAMLEARGGLPAVMEYAFLSPFSTPIARRELTVEPFHPTTAEGSALPAEAATTVRGGPPGTPLRRCDQESLRLDRPGAEQDLPVVPPCLEGKGRRDEHELRALRDERAVELGEPEVVADRHPRASELRLRGHDLLARR